MATGTDHVQNTPMIESLKAEVEHLKRQQAKWMEERNYLDARVKEFKLHSGDIVQERVDTKPRMHSQAEEDDINQCQTTPLSYDNDAYCGSMQTTLLPSGTSSPEIVSVSKTTVTSEGESKHEDATAAEGTGEVDLSVVMEAQKSNTKKQTTNVSTKSDLPLVDFGDAEYDLNNLLLEDNLLSLRSTDSNQEMKCFDAPAKISELVKHSGEQQKQIAFLECKCQKLEEERNEIMTINHMWEEQYQSALKQFQSKLKAKEGLFQSLKRQMSEDRKAQDQSSIEEKDAEIKELKQCLKEKENSIYFLKKEALAGRSARQMVESLQSTLEHTVSILEVERKGKEFFEQREQNSQQQIKSKEELIAVLQNQVESGAKRQKLLEAEVKRLALVIEDGQYCSSPVEGGAGGVKEGETKGQRRENSKYYHERSEEHREQIELLKHQMSTYAEDFKCEREEKERVIEENEKLKNEIVSNREQLKTLFRQVKVYESSFRREREERIRLLRLVGHLPPEAPNKWEMTQSTSRLPYTPYWERSASSYSGLNVSARTPPESYDKYSEYLKLAAKKEKILHKMNELQLLGINPYTMASARKSKGSSQRESDDMFHGGNLVHDSNTPGSPKSESKPPLSPKFPTSCPRCGMQSDDKKDFLQHYENCTST